MDEVSRNLTPFQVLIVGLGNVGFQYDVNSANQILTHYKGLVTAARVHNLEIEITGVDPVLQKRLLFEEKWVMQVHTTHSSNYQVKIRFSYFCMSNY